MMLLAFYLLLAGCHGVEGDSILGRDLASADARFSVVPAEERLAYAPLPGARRLFGPVELGRIAQRFGVAGEFEDVCFEVPTRQLETAEVMTAVRSAMANPEAEIWLADFSRYAAPKGEIVFPPGSLARPSPLHPDDPVLWRGYVSYAGSKRFTVWAKLRIQITERRVVAAQDIPAAQPVQPSQLRIEPFSGFPSAQPLAHTLEEVAGFALRRPIRAGSPVQLDAVESSRADGQVVRRGETVAVEAKAGMALLKFEGRAESNGGTGETVIVRNAKSGKTFPARVMGRGKVAVEPGGEDR